MIGSAEGINEQIKLIESEMTKKKSDSEDNHCTVH